MEPVFGSLARQNILHGRLANSVINHVLACLAAWELPAILEHDPNTEAPHCNHPPSTCPNLSAASLTAVVQPASSLNAVSNSKVHRLKTDHGHVP